MASRGEDGAPKKMHTVLCSAQSKIEEALGLLEDGDKNVRDKLQEVIGFLGALEPFASSKSTPLSPLVKSIIEKAASLDFVQLYQEGTLKYPEENKYALGMISATGQVQLLQFLIRKICAKNILEVGTYIGYAAFGMAEAMTPGGKVTGIDYEPYFCDFVNKTAKEHNLNVEAINGEAIPVLNSLAKEGQKYDFIYIDCVKEEYSEYYKIIMDNDMLNQDGIIACDNVIYYGRAIEKKDVEGIALDKFSTLVLNDERVTSVMLPCFDGLLLIQHKK